MANGVQCSDADGRGVLSRSCLEPAFIAALVRVRPEAVDALRLHACAGTRKFTGATGRPQFMGTKSDHVAADTSPFTVRPMMMARHASGVRLGHCLEHYAVESELALAAARASRLRLRWAHGTAGVLAHKQRAGPPMRR